MTRTAAALVDVEGVRPRVDALLAEYVAAERVVLTKLGPDSAVLSDAVEQMLSGGKRLRAAFCYWSFRAHGGQPGTSAAEAVLGVGAALELFQAAALFHDDVMDDSDTRRGLPAAHRVFAAPARAVGVDRQPRPLRRGGRDPARRPHAGRQRVPVQPSHRRPAGRHRDPGPGGVRPHADRGDRRPVPRRPRAGAALGPGPGRRRGPGAGGHPGQVGALQRRAPARRSAPRWPGRTATRARRAPPSGCRWARPSSCATTCSASSAIPPRPASPPATTSARASARSSSPGRWPPATTPSARPCGPASACATCSDDDVASVAGRHPAHRCARRGRAPHRAALRCGLHGPRRRAARRAGQDDDRRARARRGGPGRLTHRCRHRLPGAAPAPQTRV